MPSALRFLLLIIGLVALLLGGLAWWVLRTPEWERAVPVSSVLPRDLAKRSGFPPADARDCKACHLAEFNEWAASQHAHANRLVNPLQDGPAFNPTRTFREGLLTTTVMEKWNRLIVRQTGLEGIPSYHRAVAVIGVGPLIQYLTPFRGGRLQVINPAYDPKNGDWFDIYKAEPRGAHEWGFWKNGGMNWNSQCAYCHTTGFQKNYDPATDSFASTWKAMGISCEQCHGPLDGHAAKPKVPVRLNPRQDMETCAACHSRREELTGKFLAGECFDEHFRVALPDLSDLYFPDGQVRDEDFEYGSFLTSKMGKAGISCLDCHNPHSGKLKLPATTSRTAPETAASSATCRRRPTWPATRAATTGSRSRTLNSRRNSASRIPATAATPIRGPIGRSTGCRNGIKCSALRATVPGSSAVPAPAIRLSPSRSWIFSNPSRMQPGKPRWF